MCCSFLALRYEKKKNGKDFFSTFAVYFLHLLKLAFFFLFYQKNAQMLAYSVRRPLFLKEEASPSNHDETERLCPGRVDAAVVPSGTLDAVSTKETLQSALTRLEEKRRQGRTIIPVAVPVQDHTNLADLSNLHLSNLPNAGSNNTLDTLNSSLEMLTPDQAAKLSPTNAPVMKPSSLAKKPVSVRSL